MSYPGLSRADARPSGLGIAARITLLLLLTMATFTVFHYAKIPGAIRAVKLPQPIAQFFTPRAAPPAPAAPDTFDVESAMPPGELLDRWQPMIAEASRRMHVPAGWIRAVMRQESGGRTVMPGNRPITSTAGAEGLMQLMPGTYSEMSEQYGLGDDPFDPHDNIVAAAGYLRWLYKKYGFPKMFAAYNDGPGNFESHLAGKHKLPAETRAYLAHITAHLKHRHLLRSGHRTLRMAHADSRGDAG